MHKTFSFVLLCRTNFPFCYNGAEIFLKALSNTNYKLLITNSSVVPPQLQTVEQILPDDVKGQEHRRQRLQVGVGHPDAHGRVLLSEELSARHGVAVAVSEPLAEAELYGAHHCREDGSVEDNMLVSTTLQEDVVDGVAQSDEQGYCPKVKRQVAVFAEPFVGFRRPCLQRQHEEKGESNRGGDALQNHQEGGPEAQFRMNTDEGEIERRGDGHHDVAEHGVGGGRHAVGAEHRGDDHHRGGHGTEGTHHESLRQGLVARHIPHQQVESGTDRQLEEYQPEMQHGETEVP